jgi:hypothetical protein
MWLCFESFVFHRSISHQTKLFSKMDSHCHWLTLIWKNKLIENPFVVVDRFSMELCQTRTSTKMIYLLKNLSIVDPRQSEVNEWRLSWCKIIFDKLNDFILSLFVSVDDQRSDPSRDSTSFSSICSGTLSPTDYFCSGSLIVFSYCNRYCYRCLFQCQAD